MPSGTHQHLIVALTGASGSSLALSFFENFPVADFFWEHSKQAPHLISNGLELSLNLHVIISPSAHKVFNHEQNKAGLATVLAGSTLQDAIIQALARNAWAQQAQNEWGITSKLVWHSHDNVAAAVASGSFYTQGMVVIPASQGCIGRIAHGQSSNLIERAADVCLKEKRPLILVPRESPLHSIALENLLTLSRFPAVSIIPAMIPYYIENPSLNEMNQFIVSRVLQHLGVIPQKEYYQVRPEYEN